MKIKVVDRTYEQALALPPQVHKKPKKPSLLFRTVLRAVSAPDLLSTHFHCEKIGMEQIKSDEPCLVLMNHSCFLDLKIAEAVLYPRPFNIVCTSDGFVGKEWLMRSVGCIPTRKFCSDTTLVRDMLYCVRTLKTSVLLYPEASYSFDGTATPLPESIGKCVKALNVPVVMIRTYGAFARALQWAAKAAHEGLGADAVPALVRRCCGAERRRDQRAHLFRLPLRQFPLAGGKRRLGQRAVPRRRTQPRTL